MRLVKIPKDAIKNKNNYSRMSTASKLREMLFKAREYQAKLDAAAEDPSKKPAYDMKLEALLPVLRREIPLKAHAHRADDIFTAIRIAKEFDVKLTIEHCTDGALIAEDLAKENYPVAVGPSFGHATKYELKNRILQDTRHFIKGWLSGFYHYRRSCHSTAVSFPLCRACRKIRHGCF